MLLTTLSLLNDCNAQKALSVMLMRRSVVYAAKTNNVVLAFL